MLDIVSATGDVVADDSFRSKTIVFLTETGWRLEDRHHRTVVDIYHLGGALNRLRKRVQYPKACIGTGHLFFDTFSSAGTGHLFFDNRHEFMCSWATSVAHRHTTAPNLVRGRR
jgi:hypothetical protein